MLFKGFKYRIWSHDRKVYFWDEDTNKIQIMHHIRTLSFSTVLVAAIQIFTGDAQNPNGSKCA